MYRRATAISAQPIPSPPLASPATPSAQPIPTSLRLQFNASGAAQEIDAKNIKWRALNPEETRLVAAPLLSLCLGGESYVRKPGGGLITTAPSLIDPTFCLEKFKSWIFLLSFEKPITYKKIKANAYGATLPDWDNKGMTENSAVVWFHGELKNLVLTIEAVD
jgi:hypothetical protein